MKLIEDASQLNVYSEANFLKELARFVASKIKEKIAIGI